MMRLRQIWIEGSFSVLKREHCLEHIRKRGIPGVTEECLLSAMALNLKRMVKTISFTALWLFQFQYGFIYRYFVAFVNTSLIVPYLHKSEFRPDLQHK